MLSLSFSTVITNYNRCDSIIGAIQSALDTFPEGELIIVDDASTDNSVEFLRERYKKILDQGRMVIIQHDKNLGVSAAKNSGYIRAQTDWVVFLDSDDTYIAEARHGFLSALQAAKHSPIIFFRCIDQYGALVGSHHGEALELDLSTYAKYGSFGEALTAINKKIIFDSLPYFSELRGYEGLGCCRLIKRYGSALLSPIVARLYYRGSIDALSSFSGILKRAHLLATGHRIMACEFKSQLGCRRVMQYHLKAIIYNLLSFFSILLGR